MVNEIFKFIFRAILILFLFISQFNSINAQSKTRDKFDYSMTAKSNGLWYNPEYNQFEVKYPKLQTVPTISVGTEDEALQTYLYYFDSLMKTTDRYFIYNDYLDRWLKNEGANNDTVHQAIKYLYKVVDYNPVLLAQYDYNRNSTTYKININSVRGWIEEIFSSIISSHKSNSQALQYMLENDYILKVHVNSIEALQHRKYPPNKGIYPSDSIYKVTAIIVDTLKGQFFSNCFVDETNLHDEKLQSDISEICFTYVKGPYQNEYSQFKLDPSLIGISGNLTLQPGQDLIVVLKLNSHLVDYNFDYFKLSLITVFPIIEGQFRDISHIWSQSNSLSYEDWKNIFLQKRAILLNGEY